MSRSARMLRDAAALEPFGGAWDRLAGDSGIVAMQSFEWCAAAAATVAGRGACRILVDGDEGGIGAVAPLVLRGGRLELLGAGELFEPADLLAATPEALAGICESIARLGRPLRLERVPADSPTPRALRAAFARRGRVFVREAPAWPSLELGAAWAGELGGGLGSRRRSDLRRALRRAEREGGVAVRLLSPRPGEEPALLEQAFSVEERGWKGRAGTALARDEARAAFFRDLAARAARTGRLRVGFLDIGGEPAAMQLALEWQRRAWLLKIGYDEAFRHCSPGVLLLAHAVSDAAARGLSAFELLGTAEGWVEPWTTHQRETVTVIAYPADPRAVPAAARDATAIARRRGARGARRAAKAVKRAAVRVAETRYLAGPGLDDAIRLERSYADAGLLTVVGYWNDEQDEASLVVTECRAQLAALAGRRDGQISVKLPALGGDPGVLGELLAVACGSSLGIHLDSLAPETQTAALEAACALAPQAGGRLGCTLPGRWTRSLLDAEPVARAGLRVRVVKSEWPSPQDPSRDPRRGFVEVVESLIAAAAPHVAVATHDAPLAERSLAALLEAAIPCELQVLHGMRARPAMEVARSLAVPVRVYVPYGHGRLPYSLERAAFEPATAARLARDLVRRNRAL